MANSFALPMTLYSFRSMDAYSCHVSNKHLATNTSEPVTRFDKQQVDTQTRNRQLKNRHLGTASMKGQLGPAWLRMCSLWSYSVCILDGRPPRASQLQD